MRKNLLIRSFVILGLLGTQAFGDENTTPSEVKSEILLPTIESRETEMPVATLFRRPGRRHSPNLAVIAVFWPDGKVIWSEEPIDGGPPYKEGQVDQDALKEALDKFNSLGFFENPNANYQDYGAYDASFTYICLVYQGRFFRMSSWHERVEKQGDWIATDQRTIRLEDGQTREDIWDAEASDEYKEFRLVWTEIKDTLLALIPTKEASSSDASFDYKKFEVSQQ